MPKGQDPGGPFSRLHRRIDNYRKHHDEVVPRFENTTSSQNAQQKQDTQQLRNRFLETNKAKKSTKKSEKKQHSDSSRSSSGPSKANKRQNEDDQNEGYEPPSKIGNRGNSSPLPVNSSSSLYKQGFSQNGKRGGSNTKAIDSQKYHSPSSNHPKNGLGKISQPPPPLPPTPSTFPTSTSVPEFKKENSAPSLSEFADLDQCAAALQKDAAKNGAITGSFLGESSTSEIFNSEVFNDLISDLSDLNPEVMSDYCLDDRHSQTVDPLATLHGGSGDVHGNGSSELFHPVAPVTPTTTSSMRNSTMPHGHMSGVKVEGTGNVDGATGMGVHSMDRGLSHCAGPSPAPASTASPLASQLSSSSSHQPSPSQSFSGSHYVLDGGQTGSPLNPSVNPCSSGASNPAAKPSTRLPYPSPAGLSVDSPAAQTLKHMAEQHQHKAQMCINTSSTTNGSVSYKNQGSVGSPVGSPYGSMGNYNNSMAAEFSGPTNNMNPGSNCQVKQEVCSPVNPQAGFSPSPMMDLVPGGSGGGGKRPGQHNGSSPSGQSSRIPNMTSAGGSPIMSPINKSFSQPSPLNTATSQQGQIPSTQQPQQNQPPPSYMQGINRLAGPPQSYSGTNPRFPNTNNNSQISVASPKGGTYVNERGSPATQMDTKPQLRHNAPNPNLPQQPQQFTDQQFQYGNGPNNMGVEMGFHPSGHPQQAAQMQPQPQQQQQPPSSGQTINFTQQHLRMGGQPGMPVPRMPMNMNRMGVPQRIPGPGPGHMPDMQQQQRPMMDASMHPQQRMMRAPAQAQHPRHNMMAPHQQMQQMGNMQPSQPQMGGGVGGPDPGMGGQMMNRFPGMPPQMMGQQQQQQQQQQSYNMGVGGNMPMSGPGNMPMRRPYGPGSNFQGMNPRLPNEQMLSSGSQNPQNSMGNPGMSHQWVGGADGSCPPYSGGPQRHPPNQQMRSAVPSQDFNTGMPHNQAHPVPGNGGYLQPHEHMTGMQQNPNFNMGPVSQNHSQQRIPQPPNFNQHPGAPNQMKMGMHGAHPQQHPQQHQQQQMSMYSNAGSGFGMKAPDNSMMCPQQNSVPHHPQLAPHHQHPQHSQQQHSHPHPPHNMYNMGNNNMNMMNGGGGQMNSNNVIPVSDQQDFNFDLLVNGIRNEGDPVDTSGFSEDLLENLDAVFR